jgi:hypothetical protein
MLLQANVQGGGKWLPGGEIKNVTDLFKGILRGG